MTVIRDDVDNAKIITVGLTTTFFIVALILFVQAFYLRYNTKHEAAKRRPPRSLVNYESEQKTKLNDYAWVNRDEGKVRIPIDRAMKATLAELSTGDRALPE